MKHYFLTLCLLAMGLSAFAIDQLTLGSTTYNVDTLENYKAGPGTQYTAIRLKANNGYRLDAFFLKVDLTNPYMHFRVGLGRDSIYLGECPSVFGRRKTTETEIYVGGTNGDFYTTSGTDAMGYSIIGLPISTTMSEGQISLTRSNNHNVFGLTRDKKSVIGKTTFSGKAKRRSDNKENAISHVNYVRNTNELVFYNDDNGKITRTNQYGSEALVSLVGTDSWGANKTVKVKVEQIWKNKGSNAIPAGKAILSGHGTSQAFVDALAVGDELDLTFNISIDGQSLDFKEIVGGDNYAVMLRDGVVPATGTWNELHPRTGIGYSKDQNTVIQCVVDGRGASRGVTTKELGELMLASGAWTAVNLDGGGSSCLYLNGMGPQNRTSDGTERAVSNSISAVATVPTADNTIAEILTYNSVIRLPRYGVYMPKILGYNQYGILISRNVTENIQLSCEPNMGYIAEDGRFVASGSTGGNLTITYNGNISTTAKIELISEAEIAIRLDSVLISNKRPYTVEVQSIIEKDTMSVLSTALTWKSNDSNICTIENGVIKAGENGRTMVVGTLGSFKDSLLVVVENVDHSGYIHSDMSDTDNWKITAQKNWNAALSNKNIPTSWPHGGAVNYVYQTNRAPSLKLENKQRLYSLPDSMKIYMNTGDIKVSKMFVGVRANNSKTVLQKTFENLPNGTDLDIKIDFAELYDTKDMAIFPIWFEYISNQILVTSQTAGKAYAYAIRDITLYYDGVPVGLSLPSVNNSLVVFPNPVTNGEARVQLGLPQAEKVTMEVFNLQGQIVKRENLGRVSNEAVLPLQNIPAGNYFVRLTQESKTDLVKIIVR